MTGLHWDVASSPNGQSPANDRAPDSVFQVMNPPVLEIAAASPAGQPVRVNVERSGWLDEAQKCWGRRGIIWLVILTLAGVAIGSQMLFPFRLYAAVSTGAWVPAWRCSDLLTLVGLPRERARGG